MDAFEKAHQVWSACVQTSPSGRRLQREAHLDVRRGELVANEPWILPDLLLQVVQMPCDLRPDERALGATRDGFGDRAHEEGHGRPLDAVENQLQQQGGMAEPSA